MYVEKEDVKKIQKDIDKIFKKISKNRKYFYSAKDLALNLSKDVTQNITMWDERLSSEGAFNLSSNLDINVSKKVQKLDENAAQFILQGALDYLNKNNT